MKRRPLAGRHVPIIGQGTWTLERDERDRAVAALRRGLDLGMTHVDTAEMYGGGQVERVVGEAIAGRRDEVFLVSKVLPSNAARDRVIAACERSLTALGTDHLDLYLLHWPAGDPLAETFGAFERLVEQGKIRAYGVSNFDLPELEEAWSLAGERLACNQVAYHLLERTIEARVLPWCEAHGVPVVGYSPFGQGRFVPLGAADGTLEAIAADHGVTRHAVALAFLTRRDGLFAIPKSAQLAHVEANAAAGDVALSDAELARLDHAFPARPGRGLPFW